MSSAFPASEGIVVPFPFFAASSEPQQLLFLSIL